MADSSEVGKRVRPPHSHSLPLLSLLTTIIVVWRLFLGTGEGGTRKVSVCPAYVAPSSRLPAAWRLPGSLIASTQNTHHLPNIQ